MRSVPKSIRRLLSALSLAGLGISSPAAASWTEQWACIDDGPSELTVIIGGTGAPPANIRRDDMHVTSFARQGPDLSSILGRTAAVYAGEEGAFTTIADKAVLRLGQDTYFCQTIPEEPESEDVRPALEFNGQGLSLQRHGLPPSRYSFGTSTDDLLAVLGRFLGTPTSRVRYDEADACPADVVSFAAVTLYFFDGRWAGWSLNEDSRQDTAGVKVTAPSLIAIGSPAVVLEYGTTRYEDSTLGDERIGNGVHYIVTQSGRSSSITDIWAGEACVAR